MAEQPLQEFTAERWETIKSILSGEDGDKVSLTAAAREAGIARRTLNAWIRRSEEKNPGDDPLIHEIAPFIGLSRELQSDALEDELWYRAMTGVDHPVIHKGRVTDTYKKVDNKLLLRALEVRNERYQPTSKKVNVHISDASEIYARLLAGHRIAAAERAREIELEKSQYQVLDEAALPDEYVTPPPAEEEEPDLTL